MKKKGKGGQPARLPNKLLMYLSPYEVWNFGPGKDYAFPGIRRYRKFISALAEVPSSWTTEINASNGDKTKLEAWLPTVWKAEGLTFAPLVVRQPFEGIEGPIELHRLLREGLRQAGSSFKKARFRVAFPIPDEAMNADRRPVPSEPHWEADPGLRRRIGKGKRITIIAVIDDDLPFAHRNFHDARGRTRVEFCWLQSAAHESGNGSVRFGREYTRAQIDDYVARHGDDEDRLYREAGATTDTEGLGSMIDRHATHGAHVMDLATGYSPERGEDPAEEIRIIGVQLPNTIAWDTSGFGKDMYMLAAFHYIFHRADIIAEGYKIAKPRLVINFSYGFSGGRHDGATELEAAIQQLVRKRRECCGPTALVLPAGNMFLDRLHGQIRNRDFRRGKARFAWRIQPNDRTPSYLELWFRKEFDATGHEIELWDPSGHRRGWLAVGASRPKEGDPRRIKLVRNVRRTQIGQISADYHRHDRWRVLIVMAPSEPENPECPATAAGEWTIVIKRTRRAKPLTDPIYCWIQRDADPGSFHSGSRQSYFHDPRDVRYEDDGSLRERDTPGAFTRRFGTLNGLATGSASMVVAGFRLGAGLGSALTDVRPVRYSTAGILRKPKLWKQWPRTQVACSSMSDRSYVLPGTIAAGVRSGARSFLQGTSAAAPFVARQLASAFVTASDDAVEKAAAENYRELLLGRRNSGKEDGLTKARLGAVRVRPHRQPSVELAD